MCGNKDLTKEHIFGAAVAQIHQVPLNWSAEYFDTKTGSPAVRKGGGPILNVTSRLLCKTCNSVTLGRELREAIPPLTQLIRGECSTLSCKESEAMRRYWERVALLADVNTSNHQIDDRFRASSEYKRSKAYRSHPPLFNNEDRKQWLAGKTLENLEVFVGSHLGVLGINPVVKIPNGQVTQISPRKGKNFVCAIGQLAVVACMGPSRLRPIPDSYSRLFPGRETPIKAGAVTYDDFFSVLLQDFQTVALRTTLECPKVVSGHETYARLNNGFGLPPEYESLYVWNLYRASFGMIPSDAM